MNVKHDTDKQRPPAQDAPATHGALPAVALAMLLAALGTSSANIALPALVRVFAVSFQHVQWVVLAYLLTMTTVIVSVGRLGDLLGRRRLLLGGLLLFTVASLCAGLASFGGLLAARALQGLGAAAMMALSMAFVADIVPRAQTGRAMGMLGSMSALGTALGPSLGGLLLDGPGWRAIFLINVPLGLLALWLAWRALPTDSTPRRAERLDWHGTLLLALTLAAYALAMTLGRGHAGLLNALLLLAAVIGASVFIRQQQRASAPLIRPAMLRDTQLRRSLGGALLVSTVMMATLVVGPFYLSQALGLGSTIVGLLLAAGPVIAALSGVPAGYLVDRFGARRMVLTGLGGMLTGCSALAMLPVTLGTPGYLLPIALTTAAYALFQAANNTMVMNDAGTEQRGSISGLLNLARNLGLITGTAVLGTLFAASMDHGQPAAVARAMHHTFAAAAVLIAVALCIAAGKRRAGVH